MFLLPVYHLVAYYFSLVLFGLGGLWLSLFSLLCSWLPATDRTERFFQRLIHRHFVVFIGWLRFSRLCHVHYHGLEKIPPGGLVLAANHPGLMDITYLIARIPEAFCIFKPGIGHNPVLGAAARRAGYLAGDGGTDLVREIGQKLAAGNKLVIFPEGTRTPPGAAVLPFKPGFVLMARRGGVPIQLVRIRWDSNILAKGQAWWKRPTVPARVDVEVGPLVEVAPSTDPTAMAQQIEAWFRQPPPRDEANASPAPVLAPTPRWSAAP